MNNKHNIERYQRQILLKELGESGQQKLFDAKVLVIGAGGLSCPALQYLAAAGVGTIGIVDFDVVEISNLQRQILYTTEDIGKPKVEAAAVKLHALNPDVKIQTFNLKLDNINALEIINDFDLVIDGSDNFSTRYLVNDACVILNKVLIYGAVLRMEGQVGVFNMSDKVSGLKTNYRDLFPNPPDDGSALSCREIGVLGVVPGIIGTMQATEAIKIITGIGEALCNKIVSYNAAFNTFYEIAISPSKVDDELIPKTKSDFIAFNYDTFCGVNRNFELSSEEFDSMISKSEIRIIDVREPGEQPVVNEFEFEQIPLSEIEDKLSSLENKTIVFFCQSGRRSMLAAEIVKNKYPDCTVYSLAGGIIEWKKNQKVSL